jgi:hypothetical protein
MLKEESTVTTSPCKMLHFPIVRKTHCHLCLSLSKNNSLSLSCKLSLISVFISIFAQSICISLHAHNIVPSDTLTSSYWSNITSLLTPTSAPTVTLWLIWIFCFSHSISLCVRTRGRDFWFCHKRIIFLTFLYKLFHTQYEWGWKQKDQKGLTYQELKRKKRKKKYKRCFPIQTDCEFTLY